MSRRTLGFMLAMVGSAIGAWWLAVQQRSRVPRASSSRDGGTVIFDNTPRPADTDTVI